MAGPETAAVGFAALIGAGIAEELTHAAAARPWAISQRVGLAEVRTEIPREAPPWVNKWINLAPLFVGLTALGLLYLGRGLPPLSDETVLLYAAWAWFTTPSLTDLRGAAGVNHEPSQEAISRYRTAWTCLSIEALGFVVLLAADELAAIAVGRTEPQPRLHEPDPLLAVFWVIWYAGAGLMFAGWGWILLDSWLRSK